MNPNDFVMRIQKSRAFFYAFVILFFAPLAIGMALNWLDHTDERAYGDLIFIGAFLLFSFVAISGVTGLLNFFIWKCTIQGESIQYHSLFHREEFTFHDIERVAYHFAPRGGSSWSIFLSGRKRPLAVPVRTIGYDIFLECLENRDIPGSDPLDRFK